MCATWNALFFILIIAAPAITHSAIIRPSDSPVVPITAFGDSRVKREYSPENSPLKEPRSHLQWRPNNQQPMSRIYKR
ncbi:unnamed protein product [Caenorhabditis sp. 36 PRJEB53466]|nr:unnamed protein product [Caenorhabditis sp. 36 PRJEB53466]